MTIGIISWSISTKVWDRAGIELVPVSDPRMNMQIKWTFYKAQA